MGAGGRGNTIRSLTIEGDAETPFEPAFRRYIESICNGLKENTSIEKLQLTFRGWENDGVEIVVGCMPVIFDLAYFARNNTRLNLNSTTMIVSLMIKVSYAMYGFGSRIVKQRGFDNECYVEVLDLSSINHSQNKVVASFLRNPNAALSLWIFIWLNHVLQQLEPKTAIIFEVCVV